MPMTALQTARTAALAAAILATQPATRSISGPLPWRWVSERVIAPPEGSKGELGEITSLAIADDGTIYAMQKKPATVLVFGPDGKFLRTIGREGDGPGELRSGVIGVRGDLLVVQDWEASRLTVFRTNGTVVRTVPSLCCHHGASLHIDGLGRAWVPGPIPRRGSVYLRIDIRGRVVDTIPEPATTFAKTWKADARNQPVRAIYEMPVPGHPFDVAILRYDGLIMRGRNDSMRFVLSRTGRDTVRIIEGPTNRLRLTAGEKSKMIDEMVEGLPSTALQEALRKVAKPSDIPDRSTAWNGFMVDQANRTWVFLVTATGDPARFGVFDPNGKYLGEVPFPFTRLARLWVMGRDRMAAVEESDDGLPEIRVYKLVMNGK